MSEAGRRGGEAGKGGEMNGSVGGMRCAGETLGKDRIARKGRGWAGVGGAVRERWRGRGAVCELDLSPQKQSTWRDPN